MTRAQEPVVFAFVPDGERFVDGDTGETVRTDGSFRRVKRDHREPEQETDVPEHKCRVLPKAKQRVWVREISGAFVHKFTGWYAVEVSGVVRYLKEEIYALSTGRRRARRLHKVRFLVGGDTIRSTKNV